MLYVGTRIKDDSYDDEDSGGGGLGNISNMFAKHSARMCVCLWNRGI